MAKRNPTQKKMGLPPNIKANRKKSHCPARWGAKGLLGGKRKGFPRFPEGTFAGRNLYWC